MKNKYRIKEVVYGNDSKEYFIEVQNNFLWFKFWESINDIFFYHIQKNKMINLAGTFDSFQEAKEILEEYIEANIESTIIKINYMEL